MPEHNRKYVTNHIDTLHALLSMLRLKNLAIMAFMQLFVTVFLVGPRQEYFFLLLESGIWCVIAATLLSGGAGYVINDYHDVKIDAINKPFQLVVDRIITRQQVLIFYFLLNSLALVCASLAGFKILLSVCASQIILWAYSTYFKKSFLLGNFLVAVMTMFSVVIVALYFQRSYYWVGLFAVFAFFMNLVREIIKDIEDMKGDLAFGARTVPIIWGVRKTKKMIFVLIGLFLTILYLLAFLERSGQLWVLAIILSLAMGIFLSYLRRADTSKAFAKLSKICKLIMLGGILSMIFV